MTFHLAQHKGPTLDHSNKDPCPECGRRLRRVSGNKAVEFRCRPCGFRESKKEHKKRA